MHVRLPVVNVAGCVDCPFHRETLVGHDTCHGTMPPRDINLGKRQKVPLWCPLKIGPTVVGLR